MGNPLDLKRLAGRLDAAAERIAASPAQLSAETSPTDLIVSAGGTGGAHGQGRTESVPFGVLFHDPVDRLAQALDRIERYCADQPGAANGGG